MYWMAYITCNVYHMYVYIYITISNIWYRIHSNSYYIYIIYISTQVTCSLSPSPAKPHNARMIHRLVWTDLILSHQVMSHSKPIRRSNLFRQGRSWIWSLSFELINVFSSVFCFKSYMIPLWKKIDKECQTGWKMLEEQWYFRLTNWLEAAIKTRCFSASLPWKPEDLSTLSFCIGQFLALGPLLPVRFIGR
jgi:hypothetical protein